jgi:outer membrane biosynthesis protein TonB
MKLKEITYTRKYNLGNYESEDYTITAVIEKGDDELSVFEDLKALIKAASAGGGGTPEEAEEEVEEEVEEEEIVEEDEEDEEEEIVEEDEEDEVEEDEEEVEEEKPKRATKKAPTSKKSFKKKPEVYQRTNSTHKDIFAETLKTVAPDWKKTTASKAKAKEASLEMEGKDFLDDKGNVLAAFKTAVKKLMSGKKK